MTLRVRFFPFVSLRVRMTVLMLIVFFQQAIIDLWVVNYYNILESEKERARVRDLSSSLESLRSRRITRLYYAKKVT